MKNFFKLKQIGLFVVGLFLIAACEDKLSEMNINPYGIDPANANPNMLMPSVLAPAAKNYVELGFNDLAGAVQHTQKSGWFDQHNQYKWESRDWTGWYDILRTNELMIRRGEETGYDFFAGVGHAMRGF